MTKKEKLLEKLQIQRELNIRKARTSLWAYQRVIAGDFYNPQRWHLWVLSWTLQYLYERKLTKDSFWRICTNKLVPEWFRNTVDWDRLKEDFVYTNLMINTMPRAGKSRTIVNFCDWLLGQSKNNRIITVSYNTDLAADMSRYVRDGIMMEKVDPLDTVFSDIFPETKVAKGNSGFMKWALEGSFFNYLGAGLEGTITGKGANCISKGTLIATDKGNIPIEQICSDKDEYLCLSLDRKSGMLVWRKVLATREVRSNDTIRIKTVLGREIACTPEHKFFDGRRFREARTLRKGDRLYGLSKQEEQSLCNLWKAEGRQGVDLPKLLYAIKETPNTAKMCELQKVFLETLAGLQQSTEKQHRGEDVLFEGVCERSTEETLRCLWKAIKTRTEVLLSDLQGESRATEKTPRYCLSNVWENLQTNITSYEVLLKGMCEQGSFSENDREGKFGLQRWKELCEAFQNFAESCIQARWVQMLYLWQGAENNNCDLEGTGSVEDKPCLPSYRRGRDEQCSSEHDYIVQNLSPTCSQGHEDRVAGLERDSQNEHTFYDLQIEDTQNYIACTLVVHNCTIIDDPIKNAEEAYNARVLDNIWNWYTGTFLSRSEDIGEGSIDIINHTRWSTQDLCGRILDNKEMSPKWLVLSMPAEYDGELLCPDILSRRKYEELRSAMDSNIFRANYLQQPVDVEGRLFGTLKTYDETALAKPFEKIIAYCDTADEGSDYLACYIGGVREGEGYILDIIYTQDKMQITEPLTARKLYENKVNTAKIESNNGGKGFARNVERLLWENHHSRQTHIDWFHQTQNKMARILTGATFVQDHVYFPKDWETRFPELYQHITTFTKDGKNKHDDGVEALVEWGKMITGEGSINSYMEYMKKLKEGR